MPFRNSCFSSVLANRATKISSVVFTPIRYCLDECTPSAVNLRVSWHDRHVQLNRAYFVTQSTEHDKISRVLPNVPWWIVFQPLTLESLLAQRMISFSFECNKLHTIKKKSEWSRLAIFQIPHCPPNRHAFNLSASNSFYIIYINTHSIHRTNVFLTSLFN